jgi:hypothetical protein
VVVVVSAVSMWSQNVRVALVAVEGIVTVWVAESVWVVPYPSSQASHAPVCAGSAVELFKTPAVKVHGAAAPVSKPGFPISCCAAAELMVKLIVVVWLSAPEVPVTVTVDVPVVAVLLAVKVRILVEVVGLVPKVAVTPLGRPEAESVTEPVKPFDGVTLIVLLPFVPCFTVRLAGEAASEKFGCAGAFTVRLTAVV